MAGQACQTGNRAKGEEKFSIIYIFYYCQLYWTNCWAEALGNRNIYISNKSTSQFNTICLRHHHIIVHCHHPLSSSSLLVLRASKMKNALVTWDENFKKFKAFGKRMPTNREFWWIDNQRSKSRGGIQDKVDFEWKYGSGSTEWKDRLAKLKTELDNKKLSIIFKQIEKVVVVESSMGNTCWVYYNYIIQVILYKG